MSHPLIARRRIDKGNLGVPSDYPQNWGKLWTWSPGSHLHIFTAPHRTSISFGLVANEACAWVRKNELPEEIVQNLGNYYAIKGKNSIHLVHRDTYDREQGYTKSPAANAKQAINEALEQARQNHNQRQKENAMSLALNNLITDNKTAAKQAAYNEAARIALNKVIKIASGKAPLMVRGYVDTPLGALLIANLASVAAAQLRPQDATLKKLTGAMTVMAYQSTLASLDIGGMIDEMLGGDVKAALEKAGEA